LQLSATTHTRTGGSSGWQAPEQLIAKDGGTARQSRAIDVFSLGCIMFYCLSGGKHPFGEHYERDTNIIRGHCNLAPLAKWPEAVNLLGAMLSKQPLQRPAMAGVLAHPFWWSDEQRLAFLVDVSDRCVGVWVGCWGWEWWVGGWLEGSSVAKGEVCGSMSGYAVRRPKLWVPYVLCPLPLPAFSCSLTLPPQTLLHSTQPPTKPKQG
jgi:serine/threonine protein kinase